MHALVISRLDYCNSLYIGLPKYSLYRLQKGINTAARVIFKVGRRVHISPYLQKLHWLPVEERIQFKILTVTFNSVHNTGPAYLNNLVYFRQSSRALRFTDQYFLAVPKTENRYGSRAFQNIERVKNTFI